jgi:TonB family protein
MNRYRFLRLVAALACLATLPAGARADNIPDDSKAQKRAADDINKRFAELQLHKIYVPDFVNAAGEFTLLARFFAATFSKLLNGNGKNQRIVSRSDAHNFLEKNGWTDKDLANPEVLSKFAAAFGVDGILSGVVVTNQKLYKIDFTARDLAGKELFQYPFEYELTPAILGVMAVERGELGTGFRIAGLDGVTQPKCKRCPAPDYTDEARRSRFQGVVYFYAVVNAQGKVERIIVIHSVDPSLDRAAMDTIRKKWTLEPSRDAAGQIVPALVDLEVVFRLYN